MKKVPFLLAIVATFIGNVASAEIADNSSMYNGNSKNNNGRYNGKYRTKVNDDFQWGIAIGALAALGVMVGLTAASAASTPKTYSN